MSGTITQGRGLLGFLGPLTGVRARGKVFVTPDPASVGDQILPPNTWLSPVIEGALWSQMAYRVLPDYTNIAGRGAWGIPQAGKLVDIEAHLGGTRFNVAKKTVMRFADAIPTGFIADSVVVDDNAITGGTNVPYYGSDRIVGASMYEQIGSASERLDLFRAQLGNLPAVLLIWTGSASPKWAGRGAARYSELWDLVVIVDRADSDAARRGEGLRLLDAMEDLVLWRTVYGDDGNTGLGGIIVSADASVEPRSRQRISGASPFFKQTYVYSISIRAIRVANRVDFRVFEPWRKTRLDVNFPVPSEAEKLPMVVDNEFLMKQG